MQILQEGVFAFFFAIRFRNLKLLKYQSEREGKTFSSNDTIKTQLQSFTAFGLEPPKIEETKEKTH